MLTSSAVGSKKAAPKLVPRRRAAAAVPTSVPSPPSLVEAPRPLSPPLRPQLEPTTEAETLDIPPRENPSLPVDEPVNADVNAVEPPTPRPTPIETPTHPSVPSTSRLAPTTNAATNPSHPSQKRPHDPECATSTAPPPPMKKQKRTSTRSQKKTATVDNVVEPVVPQVSSRAKTRAKSRHKSAATVVDSDTEEAPEQPAEASESANASPGAGPNRKRKPRRKTGRGQAEEPCATLNNEIGPQSNENEESARADASDPELHEIDPNTLSMFELSHDARRGKVSDRERKMAEIDWAEVAVKRREAANKAATTEQQRPHAQTPNNVLPSVEGADGDATPPPDGPHFDPPAGEAVVETLGTFSFRIVDGEIVEDEASLVIDRHAAAEAAATNDAAVEEENDLTQRVNRTTWLNERKREPADRLPAWRNKSDPWTEAETDRFYDALRMFGTDFYIISQMFAPKTRRQIKHKFTREERLDGARVTAALLGPASGTPMDLAHYARHTGRDVAAYTKYESCAQAERAIRDSLKDKEAAMQAAVDEARENERQAQIQRGQKEKVRATAEQKRAEKRAMKRAGKGVLGVGTMGGAGAGDA